MRIALRCKEIKDEFLEFMKNTDEAKKIPKKGTGTINYAIYERIEPEIGSVKELLAQLKKSSSE